MPGPRHFLDLLYADAPEEAFDAVLDDAVRAGLGADDLDDLRRQRELALRLRDRMLRLQNREAELSALYETAHDLIAIRDVDAILAAIVRRARQLLRADMTYLSLNDEAEGASYMKVTDGSISAEFRNLRLPLGTGLLGLVAQTGAPYYTDDYQSDQRFLHRDYIDHAVADEGIRAILGVPLLVEGRVIGALLAVHRTVRAFPTSEVSLLTSFAAHAAVALENARLFEATERALAEVDEANRRISEQSRAVQVAAAAHDRLTEVLLRGGGVGDVAQALGEALEGEVAIHDPSGQPLAGGTGWDTSLDAAVEEALVSGRSVEVTQAPDRTWVAVALAGAEHLGTVVLRGRSAPLELSDRRTLERGAVVTALVLLFSRTVAEAEDQVRGELLADLLTGRDVDLLHLRDRARRHQTDLDRLAVVAVAEVGEGRRREAARLASRFADELGGLGGEVEGRLVVAVPSDDPVATGEVLAARLAAAAPVTVGVSGGGGAGAERLREQWREARSCLETLLRLGRTGEVSDAPGLGLARLVLGYQGPGELDGFLDRTLGPVRTYDERRGTALLGTLEAWHAHGGRLVDTAKALHVHPNTVSQRLERIGSLLGDRWREPGRALEQQLALQILRLRG